MWFPPTRWSTSTPVRVALLGGALARPQLSPLTPRASPLANEESFDPSEVARPQWHNLAFADSDASFDSPPGFDPDSQAVIFNQDTDASIDVDALGFQYLLRAISMSTCPHSF